MVRKIYFVHSTLEVMDTIKQGLHEWGFKQVPEQIHLDNREHRFDGLIDGKSRSNCPADTLRVEPQNGEAYVVIFYSHLPNGPAGAFRVQIKASTKPCRVQEHPYLIRKQTAWSVPGLRVWYGNLVVPVIDYENNNEISYQNIPPEEGKPKMLAAARKLAEGFFLVPAGAKKWPDMDRIFVAEGLATAMSVAAAANCYCAVAFGFNRMGIVANKIRALAPKAKVILALDDGINPKKIGEQCPGMAYVVPNTKGKGNDFNDLHVNSSLSEVRNQLLCLKYFPGAHNDSQKKEIRPMGINGNIEDCIWVEGSIYSVAKPGYLPPPIRHAKTVNEYQSWFRAREDRCAAVITYRPTEKPWSIISPHTVFEFNSYCPPQRSPGDATKGARLLEVLMAPVFEEDRKWLETWIAWQAQRPGQILDCHPILSSITQGSGKSTVADVVGKIIGFYANYHIIVSSEDILNPFNDYWGCSRTLIHFDDFNPEALADNKFYNKLKTLLSAPILSYTRKYSRNAIHSERTANCIFTTNDTNQLWRIQHDRRFRNIQWREQYKMEIDKRDIYHLSTDIGAIDWLREYYMDYQIAVDNLARDTFDNPSQARINEINMNWVDTAMADSNIDELSYVTTSTLREYLRSANPAEVIEAENDYRARDRLYKEVAAFFSKRRWHKGQGRVGSGSVERLYYNLADKNWRNGRGDLCRKYP